MIIVFATIKVAIIGERYMKNLKNIIKSIMTVKILGN